MTSKQRLERRRLGQSVDRPPNMSIVMFYAARQAGAPYSAYVTDARVLCEGVLRCHERFGIDCLSVISDPMREAEGFGSAVVIPYDGVPYPPEPLLRTVADIARLTPCDPFASRRMADRVEGVRLLAARSGGEVPVVGWVESAFAESCDLMKMEQVMMNLLDEPAAMHDLLRLCTEQSVRFALAQVAAGADIVGVGDAAASLIGPALFEEFALPYEQRLIAAIHGAGAQVKLHICGNTGPVAHLMALSGADLVDCDHMVDLRRMDAAMPSGVGVCGNFDPVAVLLQGSVQNVRTAARACAALSPRIVVAPGCEVPPATPEANMLALRDALNEP